MADRLKLALGVLIGAALGCAGPTPLELQSVPPVVQSAPEAGTGSAPAAPESPASEPPPTLTPASTAFPSVCPTRNDGTPAAQQEAASLDALAQLEGRYDLSGRWGTAISGLQVTPSDAPFSGSLEITRREGLVEPAAGCRFGSMVPVRVALRTADGALDDVFDGTALLEERHDAATVDHSPPPFLLEIEATLDLTQRRGTLQLADSSLASFKRAVLRASLTPFGTRGELTAHAEPGSPGASRAAPAPEPLLAWPAAAEPSCGEDVTLLPAEGGTLRSALRDAMARMAAQPMAAHWQDGTSTRLSVRVEPPRVACGTARVLLPTEARLETADGRLSARVAVKLDTSYARFFANTRSDVPWVFEPSGLAAHEISVQAPLAGLAHVGVEAWFGENVGPSEVRVIGWAAGDCVSCDAECKECSWERRMQLLGLTTDP